MRRRIRLTGRRQLPKSCVRVLLSEIAGKQLVTLTVADRTAFQHLPPQAKVSLKLVENKRVQILDFGSLQRLSTTRELPSHFTAPTCQLRVADPGLKAKGLLLASTDGWTLKGDDPEDQENSRGILQFLADDTAPQSWKLEIRESDYPLVRIDKRIPNAAMWARNDPIFVATALPAVVRQIFDEILGGTFSEDTPWVVDWLKWAGFLMSGEAPPIDDEETDRADYIERLVDSFCARHNLADQLLQAVEPEDQDDRVSSRI